MKTHKNEKLIQDKLAELDKLLDNSKAMFAVLLGEGKHKVWRAYEFNDLSSADIDFLGQSLVMDLKLKGYKTLDQAARDKVWGETNE